MTKIGLCNKALVILIVGFFLSLSGSTSYGLALKNKYLQNSLDLENVILSGDIIVVDDVPGYEYPDNPPEDYTNIQDAIDASHAYDIIFVFEGTYNEKLVIDKTIYMIGQNREKTVVNWNGIGDVVYISAVEVVVSGFTIKNSGDRQPDDHQAGIAVASDSSTITYNIIRDNPGNGIYFASSSFNKVSENKILNNHLGVFFEYSNENIVSKNEINYNDYGACLCFSNNNTITSNTISNSNLSMCINNATSNNISGNVFSNNVYGLYLNYSSCNTIYRNNFIKNKKRNALFRGFWNNKWIGNYWNRFRLLPKPIFGRMGILGLIPLVNFDWSPARKPNEI